MSMKPPPLSTLPRLPGQQPLSDAEASTGTGGGKRLTSKGSSSSRTFFRIRKKTGDKISHKPFDGGLDVVQVTNLVVDSDGIAKKKKPTPLQIEKGKGVEVPINNDDSQVVAELLVSKELVVEPLSTIESVPSLNELDSNTVDSQDDRQTSSLMPESSLGQSTTLSRKPSSLIHKYPPPASTSGMRRMSSDSLRPRSTKFSIISVPLASPTEEVGPVLKSPVPSSHVKSRSLRHIMSMPLLNHKNQSLNEKHLTETRALHSSRGIPIPRIEAPDHNPSSHSRMRTSSLQDNTDVVVATSKRPSASGFIASLRQSRRNSGVFSRNKDHDVDISSTEVSLQPSMIESSSKHRSRSTSRVPSRKHTLANVIARKFAFPAATSTTQRASSSSRNDDSSVDLNESISTVASTQSFTSPYKILTKSTSRNQSVSSSSHDVDDVLSPTSPDLDRVEQNKLNRLSSSTARKNDSPMGESSWIPTSRSSNEGTDRLEQVGLGFMTESPLASPKLHPVYSTIGSVSSPALVPKFSRSNSLLSRSVGSVKTNQLSFAPAPSTLKDDGGKLSSPVSVERSSSMMGQDRTRRFSTSSMNSRRPSSSSGTSSMLFKSGVLKGVMTSIFKSKTESRDDLASSQTFSNRLSHETSNLAPKRCNSPGSENNIVSPTKRSRAFTTSTTTTTTPRSVSSFSNSSSRPSSSHSNQTNSTTLPIEALNILTSRSRSSSILKKYTKKSNGKQNSLFLVPQLSTSTSTFFENQSTSSPQTSFNSNVGGKSSSETIGSIHFKSQRSRKASDLVEQASFQPKIIDLPKPISRIEDEDEITYLGRIGETMRKSMIAGSLASSIDPFHTSALSTFLNSFDFAHDPIDLALRKLLMAIYLPKETQQIDRVMEAFAKRYVTCNPKVFLNSDSAYILAFSIIMLHTDTFNKHNRGKMTRADYVKNTRVEGVHQEVLEYLYDNVTFTQFIFVDEDNEVNAATPSTSKLPTSSSSSSTGFFTSSSSSRNRVDPYTIMNQGTTHELRPNIEASIPSKNPFNCTGTVSFFDTTELKFAFNHSVMVKIQISKQVVINGGEEEEETIAGSGNSTMVTIKAVKVASVARREEFNQSGRKPSRKWKDTFALLTPAQVIFFRDSTVADDLKSLVMKKETLQGSSDQLESPIKVEGFKAELVISLENSIALRDASYDGSPNTLLLMAGNGNRYYMRLESEQEYNSWIAHINYAAAFKTMGVKMQAASMNTSTEATPTFSTQRSPSIVNTSSPTSKTDASISDTVPATPSQKSFILSSSPAAESRTSIALQDRIRTKLQDFDKQIATVKAGLSADLCFARNLALLTPMQTSTRMRLQAAAVPVATRVRVARQKLAKLVCYREITSREVLSDERVVDLKSRPSIISTCLTPDSPSFSLPRLLFSPLRTGNVTDESDGGRSPIGESFTDDDLYKLRPSTILKRSVTDSGQRIEECQLGLVLGEESLPTPPSVHSPADETATSTPMLEPHDTQVETLNSPTVSDDDDDNDEEVAVTAPSTPNVSGQLALVDERRLRKRPSNGTNTSTPSSPNIPSFPNQSLFVSF